MVYLGEILLMEYWFNINKEVVKNLNKLSLRDIFFNKIIRCYFYGI